MSAHVFSADFSYTFAEQLLFFVDVSHSMVQLCTREKNAEETSFFRPSNCASIGNVHKRFSWRLAAVRPIDRSIENVVRTRCASRPTSVLQHSPLHAEL